MKITIIGAGNMGGAIARGFAARKVFAAKDITCCDRSDATLETLVKDVPEIGISKDNAQAVEGADIVLFAVKPWIMPSAVEEVKEAIDYKKQLIISIAAGVGTEKLAQLFDKGGTLPQIVYLIPNIAVEVGAGVFFYCTANASKKSLDLVQELFSQVGFAKQVEEKQMSAGTALASCGIAYVFRYIRANVEGGVEMGFYPKDAQEIVLGTIKGAVELLQAHGTHPEQEVDKVTTPGGITIKGLNAMEEAGFTNAVIKGLKAGK
ncbi:MAG: pyrroline-5-carboxylate reductase [Bacteroidaceae bacterium]|nr:pyrroline-5-carboxylate reductase [Bacteroidaceae bacterium]